jgi:predicted SprT family Zn-dependent metalloprotease
MTQGQTILLAYKLMRENGLIGWKFGLNKNKRRLGVCRHRKRLIELSVDFVSMNTDEEIIDTIKHEIAHALVGPGHGHGPVWKAKARQLGCNPVPCSMDAAMPHGHFQAVCPGCGMIHSKHRCPKVLTGWVCKKCGPVNGKLTWTYKP